MTTIPTPIIDKNGKPTTVHRKLFGASARKRDIPSVVRRSKVEPQKFDFENTGLTESETECFWDNPGFVKRLCQDFGWELVAFGPVPEREYVVGSHHLRGGKWYEFAALTPDGALVNIKGIHDSVESLHGPHRGDLSKYPLQRIDPDLVPDLVPRDMIVNTDIVLSKVHEAVTGTPTFDWKLTVEDTDKIRFDYQDIPIALANRSALACATCGTFYPENIDGASINSFTRCQGCNGRNQVETVTCAIKPESVDMLRDENVRDTIWYHASVRKNWKADLARSSVKPVIHLGSKESALERASHVGDDEMFLYEIRLKTGVPISPYLELDDTDSQPMTVEKMADNERMEGDGVTRYLNRYEDCGSISLMANPDAFEVVGSLAFTPVLKKWGGS